MTNEMDLLDMDERQRLAWLRANRLTLMLVGLTWVGIVAKDFVTGERPLFMLAMIPVFALARFLGYLHYQRVPRPAVR